MRGARLEVAGTGAPCARGPGVESWCPPEGALGVPTCLGLLNCLDSSAWAG